MKKHSEKKTNVRVLARDGLTEISIIDNRFNRIASGLGSLSQDLSPGIYKVRWETASASKDELFEITGKEGGGVLNLETKMQAISTSAPLSNTKFGCIDKPTILKDLSINPPALHPKKDCQLLVFLRDEEETVAAFPASSVSVHSSDGTRLVGLNDGFINTKERFAGLMIGLNPGVYRLRVETGKLGSYEIFVFTAAGWQTRVFLTCDNFYYASETIRRPMLRTTSILMGRIGTRFDPDSQDARLAELALNALLRGDDILDSNDMQGLLNGKFDDPMLGIYGAHLLLKRKKVKWGLVNIVCRNLHKLVGPIPDLQALYIKSEQSLDQSDKRIRMYLGLPPMLIRSWDLLVSYSRKRLSVIPSGSLSDRIAGLVVSTKPWLMCRVDLPNEIRVQPMENISFARGKRVMKQMVKQVSRTDPEEFNRYLKKQRKNLNLIESALLDTMVIVNESESSGTLEKRNKSQISGFGFQNISLGMDASKITENALSNLHVPSYSFARSAVSLATKLSGKFHFDIS